MAIINVPAGASLQSAINSATDGDTLNLLGNPLVESIIINKPLIILGNGFAMDGAHAFPPANLGGNSVATCAGTFVVKPWSYSNFVRILSSDVTIDNMNIIDSQGRGIFVGDTSGAVVYSNIALRNLTIARSRANNLVADYIDGLLMENVTSYGAGDKLESSRSNAAEVLPVANLIRNNQNFAIRDCKIYGNWGEGMSIASNVRSNGIIEGNYFHDNTNLQLYLHWVEGCIVRNNAFWWSTDTAHLRTCTTKTPGIVLTHEAAFNDGTRVPNKDIDIYGNLFFGMEQGIAFRNSQNNVIISDNIRVFHNTFLEPDTGGEHQINMQIGGAFLDNYTNVEIFCNVFSGSSGTPINMSSAATGFTFHDNMSDVPLTAQTSGPGDFVAPADLQAPITSLPFNQHTIDWSNYLPNATSAAVDAAPNVTAPADALGTARTVNGASDKGALEFDDVINQPPTITTANQTNEVGQSVSYTPTAGDSDGDTLTFTATGLPPGVTINANTGEMSGVPLTDGSYSVVVCADDGN